MGNHSKHTMYCGHLWVLIYFRQIATSYEYVLLLGSHKHPLAGPSDDNLL